MRRRAEAEAAASGVTANATMKAAARTAAVNKAGEEGNAERSSYAERMKANLAKQVRRQRLRSFDWTPPSHRGRG